jgi:phosphatidylserine/phosphatidylglycerophosphate/cardiolipin synthase-like enzyme
MRGFWGFLSLGVTRYGIKDCIKIFNKAETVIRIIIPNSNTDFFWSDSVVDALQKAVAREVRVEILCDEKETTKSGVLGVVGAVIFKKNLAGERFRAVVDAKHSIIQKTKTGPEKIEVGLIVFGGNSLSHQIDMDFEDLIGK